MTVTIAALVLRLARTTAAGADVPAMLADVCRTAQPLLGVRAVVAAAGRPSDSGPTAVGGSDDTADRIARLQRESRGGPLNAVLRTGRPLHTADLTRIGPPELAAAAAEAGLGGSLTVPLIAGGEPMGALQLLVDAGRSIGPDVLEPVAAVLDVLTARLADVAELRRLAPADSCESETAVIRVAGRPVDDGEESGPPDLFQPATGPRSQPARTPRSGPGHNRREPAAARVEAPGSAGGGPGEPPTERLPTAPKAAPQAPDQGATQPPGPAPRPAPTPRPAGPSDVRVPAPRYHEPSAATFFSPGAEPPAAEVGAEVSGAVNGSVNGSVAGPRGRHGRPAAEGDAP